ncbi:hypothetical protein [Chryseobacterium wanjuense]
MKGKGTKKAKIQELFDRILLQNENAIIYCNTKSNAEKIARDYERIEISTETFSDFLNHLTTTFDERWIVIKALKKGLVFTTVLFRNTFRKKSLIYLIKLKTT